MSGRESDAIVSFYTGNGPSGISDSSVNEQSLTYISRGDLHNSAPPLLHRPAE